MGRWVQYVFGLLGLAALAAAPCDAVLFPYRTLPVGSSASVVAIGDLTVDGRADVAVATRAAADPVNDRCVFLFRQTADGTLAAPARFVVGVEAHGIAIGDLNGDGRADLAVCGDGGVVVLRQSPAGGFEPAQFVPTGAGADGVAIGDLNGDGRADLAVSHADAPQVSVLYQTPEGSLGEPQRYRVADAGENEIAIGDLNGDGLADLLFMRGSSGRASLSLLPQDPVTHRLGGAFRYGWGEDRPSHGFALADLNGDHRLDVAMTWGDERPECGLGIFYQGAGGLNPAIPCGSVDGPGPIKAADMNRDGRLDLVVAHAGWQALSTFIQQPDGRFGPERLDPIPYNSHYEPQGLAVGDLNGDGWPDVALADDSHGLLLLYNAGARDIAPPDTAIVSHPPAISSGEPAVFRFAGTDSGTHATSMQYRWNLDGGLWSAFSASASVTLTGLAEGWHDFSVAARDAVGNVDPTPAVFHFGVDRTPPFGVVMRGVGAYTVATGVSVTVDAEDNLSSVDDLTYAWRVDGGPWSDFSYAWKITLTGLFEGAHTLEAKVADPAGNIAAPVGVSFTVDRTPPNTSVGSVSHDPATGAVTVTFSGTDTLPPPNALVYSWRVDGGTWSAFSAATQATLPRLAPGSHHFEVRARDAAGNIDPTPAGRDL